MKLRKKLSALILLLGMGIFMASAAESVQPNSQLALQANAQCEQNLQAAVRAWLNGDDASSAPFFDAMIAENSANPIPWHLRSLSLFEKLSLSEDPQRALSLHAVSVRLMKENSVAYSDILPLCRSMAQTGLARAQLLLGKMNECALGTAQNFEEAVRLYRMAAEQGNVLALSNLADCSKRGVGGPQNNAAAMEYYLKAVDLSPDNPVLLYNLALAYYEGRETAQNLQKAMELMRQAAEAGLPDGCASLGYMYIKENVKSRNVPEALRWLKRGVELGSASAENTLGSLYFSGDGVEKDEKEALRLYRLAAEAGLAIAQRNLGYAYSNGIGTTEDKAEAARWYRLAAEQGDAEAQNTLGYLYLNGSGVERDYAEAMRLFKIAADGGNADACQNIAIMYFNGLGVRRDEAQTVRWTRKAAQQGAAEAQYNLGCHYSEGIGIGKDEKQAFFWFAKAAEQGHLNAQNNLGQAYRYGRGVPIDEERAFQCYRDAAQKGNAMALFNLGLCFKDGAGTPLNIPEAYVCFALARIGGIQESESLMKEIEEQGFAADKAQSDQIFAEVQSRIKELTTQAKK